MAASASGQAPRPHRADRQGWELVPTLSDEFNENALDGKKWDNGESSSNAVARGSRSVRKAPSIRSRPDGKGRVTVAVQNTKNYSAKPTPDRHRAFVIPFVADYVIEWDALNHPVPFDEKDAL